MAPTRLGDGVQNRMEPVQIYGFRYTARWTRLSPRAPDRHGDQGVSIAIPPRPDPGSRRKNGLSGVTGRDRRVL